MHGDEPEPTQTGGYSIRVTSRMTGISADQLRVWERRYGFPKPGRNASGNRVYSDEQVHRLTLIGRALSAGYRARDAVTTPPDELRRMLFRAGPDLVRAQSALGNEPTLEVEGLVHLLRSDNLPGLRAELRRVAAARGPKEFVTEVASRLTRRVGDGWACGELEVRHEHLLTEVLSSQLQLLLAAYDDQGAAPSVVLGSFPNEQHGLGLEMAALFLAVHDAKPSMLGVNTPPEQIGRAALAFASQVVGVSVSLASDISETHHYLGLLLSVLPRNARVWLGGENGAQLAINDARVRPILSWSQLEKELQELQAARTS